MDRRAAPCGHFATLVRSTFGLRGYPPLRFGASVPFRWRFTMSKKVLGFTSRKWVAFWWGLICGVVIGGLAVSYREEAGVGSLGSVRVFRVG